jgi:hypothetical protein
MAKHGSLRTCWSVLQYDVLVLFMSSPIKQTWWKFYVTYQLGTYTMSEVVIGV